LELGFPTPNPVPLSWGNQAAIHIASNPVSHERTKRIEVDFYSVQDKILSGDIATPFVKSEDQFADLVTKSLCRSLFKSICFKLGLYNIYALA
jgi:hypothetical protein